MGIKKVFKYVWIKTAMPKWICLTRMLILRNSRKVEIETGINLVKTVKSDLKIDIVIPVIEKDLLMLPYVVESIKKNIKHPVERIYIVGPNRETITKVVEELGVTFVDENDVLEISKNDIYYEVSGMDRSGWLFQQLLKLGMEKNCKCENYLVMDADTVIVKPTVFDEDGKIVFDCSDERHEVYYRTYEKLLGQKPLSTVSFVAHHMLFNKLVLKDMKEQIERNCGMVWYKAIIEMTDKNEISGFSEYETYGNYFFEKFLNKMIIKYWYNVEVDCRLLKKMNIATIVNIKGKNNRTVSLHSYNLTKT